MQLQLDDSLRARITGVTFGMVTIQGASVSERNDRLWSHIEALCQRQASEFTLERLSENPQIAAVRGLQKSFGFDPTRYRPSSEALLRRVLKEGLHQVKSAGGGNKPRFPEWAFPY